MSFAATLLLMSAPAAVQVPAQPVIRPQTSSQRHAPIASAIAGVEIVEGERVVFERIDEKRSPRTTIRRDAGGTVWVEFS